MELNAICCQCVLMGRATGRGAWLVRRRDLGKKAELYRGQLYLGVTVVAMLSNHWNGMMRQWKEDFFQSFPGEGSIILPPRTELTARCHVTIPPLA